MATFQYFWAEGNSSRKTWIAINLDAVTAAEEAEDYCLVHTCDTCYILSKKEYTRFIKALQKRHTILDNDGNVI